MGSVGVELVHAAAEGGGYQAVVGGVVFEVVDRDEGEVAA
jgi:hypothetical protein